MTAADELTACVASIRAGDMPADPEKFLEAVADWLAAIAAAMAEHEGEQVTVSGQAAAAKIARAWNADLP